MTVFHRLDQPASEWADGVERGNDEAGVQDSELRAVDPVRAIEGAVEQVKAAGGEGEEGGGV